MSSASSSRITGKDRTGKIHEAVGYKAMKAAPGSVLYMASKAIKKVSLPRKVDMRSTLTPVEDQGNTSSCVANAVAGAYEYWIKRLHNEHIDISRLFVYYNARLRAGEQDEDAGSYIQYAMDSLGKYGACTETTWPFKKKLLKSKPSREAYKEAVNYRVKKRLQLPVELDDWKRCLAEGKPIVFGCVLFDSFDDCSDRGGVVPMPSPKEAHRKSHDGHSMLCVGYSDVDEVFIIRNSWGEEWGDKGYCYMPYNYLMNPKFNDGDCWAFLPDEELPLNEEPWQHDDQPVVNDGKGVDFEINPYAIADYSSVALNFLEKLVPKEYSTFSSFLHTAADLLAEFAKGDDELPANPKKRKSGDSEDSEEEEDT